MAGLSLSRVLHRSYAFLKQLIAPGPESTQYYYYQTLQAQMKIGARWIDFGCGHNVFGFWMNAEELEMVSRASFIAGVDLDLDSVKQHASIRNIALANLEQLPFPAGHFDIATANMVMEHVVDPLAVLLETNRILKQGGKFVFHTPNLENFWVSLASKTPDWLKLLVIRILEQRAEADVYPTLYKSNTVADIVRLAEESGFRVEKLQLCDGPPLTASLGPLALPELVWQRLRSGNWGIRQRSNFVAVLNKL